MKTSSFFEKPHWEFLWKEKSIKNLEDFVNFFFFWENLFENFFWKVLWNLHFFLLSKIIYFLIVVVDTPKKEKKAYRRPFFLVYHTFGLWQHDSLCAYVSRVRRVCESLFLILCLGVATNHWFCIRCDWSPIFLILFSYLIN